MRSENPLNYMFGKLFKKKNSKSPADLYLEHLDRVFGKEPEFFKGESLQNGIPAVSTIIYRDHPEKGMVTGVTYGLSLVRHPNWKLGRPELMITVGSEDTSWAHAAGYVANKLRGDCPFSYSNTINLGEKISDGSNMDAFFVFAPSVLTNKADYLDIDVGTDYKIHIAGLYPIHASETKFIEKWGLEKFWKHPAYDMYDVNRRPIV